MCGHEVVIERCATARKTYRNVRNGARSKVKLASPGKISGWYLGVLDSADEHTESTVA